MPTTAWARRPYEAAVLLVPVDVRARAALTTQPTAALDGISIAPESRQDPSGEHMTQAALQADIVVLLSYDLAAVDASLVSRVSEVALRTGAPVGALVVTPDRSWSAPAALQGAVVLREASDTVVVLGDLSPAMAFLQVLRGGRQEPAVEVRSA